MRGANPAPKGPWPHHTPADRLSQLSFRASLGFGMRVAALEGAASASSSPTVDLCSCSHPLAAHFAAQNLMPDPDSPNFISRLSRPSHPLRIVFFPRMSRLAILKRPCTMWMLKPKLLSEERNCAARLARAAGHCCCWAREMGSSSPYICCLAATVYSAQCELCCTVCALLYSVYCTLCSAGQLCCGRAGTLSQPVLPAADRMMERRLIRIFYFLWHFLILCL